MMKSLNNVLLFSFLISMTVILGSCSSSASIKSPENVIGSYEWVGGLEVWARLNIKTDSTFTYSWKGGLASGETMGTWRLKEACLVLNSTNRNDSSLILEERFDPILDLKTIYTMTTSRVILPQAHCSIETNGKTLTAMTDSLGKVTFDVDKIEYLKITYFDFDTFLYSPTNKTFNYFVVGLQEVRRPGYDFLNEKWNFKNDLLYNPYFKKSGGSTRH